MVTGQRPFDVDSFAGLAAAVRLSPPGSLRELRPDAPDNLERTLQRALAIDPRDRFQSMREFATAIDSVLQTLSASTSIAIVPFTLSTSDDGSGLADAVTEAVADDLSGVGAVKVIRRSELDDSRSTVGHFNASAWSVTDDARVLLGTVAVNGPTTIVSARLFDPAQNRAVADWQIQAGSSELPRLSTDLSRAILSELGVRLSAAERRRLSARPRISAGSYVPYYNGRRQMSRGNAQACLAAIASFERAAAEAPQEPFAYAGIAEACVGVIEQGCAFDRDQVATRARSELKNALQIDAVEPEVEFAAAEVAYRLDGSPVPAEARLRRVLTVWPGHIRAALRLAECLVVTGTFHDAIMMAREAAERHPRSPGVLRRAGRVFHFANAYGDAARMFSAALDGEPDDVVARFDLALTLAKSGDVSGARAQCDAALASDEGRALAVAAIGNAAKVHGDTAQHDAARRYLCRFQNETTVSACWFRLLDVAFGHTGRPLEYLEIYDEALGLAKFMGFAPVDGSLSALVASVGLIAYLDVEPSFHAIYGASAFTALLDQLNNTP
jgi:Flp pilus assembly protein TadD/TolB-like protein